ncbi:MAG: hypothetical protein NTU94_03050 [Planctomycetota bacterium]|nr:hypothetical protein [Planctomycetota bacterium]
MLQRAEVKWQAAADNPKLQPHYLVMTATPIPRTLALTVFGDLGHGARAVDHLEGPRQVDELEAGAHRLGQRLADVREARPQRLLGELHERRLLEALGGRVLDEDGAGVGVALLGEGLELRVLHLEAAAVLAHAPVKEVLRARVEGLGEEAGVEPDGPHRAGLVLDEGLEPVAPPRRPHVDDPRADGLLDAGLHLGDGHAVAAVDVLAREELEGVADRLDAELREQRRPLRADALQVLDAVAEFRHRHPR